MPTRLVAVSGDITAEHVDAIVNAANSSLLGGGGVDGAIHRAGGPAILTACRELRRTAYPDGLPTGEAAWTTAGDLDARWVIHAVGPVFSTTVDRTHQLASAYLNSLRIATELRVRTIAFPAISAGVYGWPMEDAARVAVEAVRRFVAEPYDGSVELVRFVLFGPLALEAFRAAIGE